MSIWKKGVSCTHNQIEGDMMSPTHTQIEGNIMSDATYTYTLSDRR